MPKYTVATPGFAGDAGYAPVIKRGLAITSVGTKVWLVASPNINGKGGDNTGVQKIYILATTDAAPTTFTVVGSWNYSPAVATTVGDIAAASMVVDQSNNLHVAYSYFDSTTSQSLRYRKLTNTGATTWTVGAEAIAQAATTNRYYWSTDIAIANNDLLCPVIVAACRDGVSPTFTSRCIVRMRLTAGGWISTEPKTLPGNLGYSDVSIATRLTVDATTTNIPVVLTYAPGTINTGATDTGDYIFRSQLSIGSGISNFTLMYGGINKGLSAGWRQYHAFFLGGSGLYLDRFFVHGVSQYGPLKEWMTVFNFPTTASVVPTVLVAPTSIDTASAVFTRLARKVNTAQLIRSSTNTNEVQIASFMNTASAVYLVTHEYDFFANTITSTQNYRQFSLGSTVAASYASVYSGDTARFPIYSTPRCMSVHAKNSTTTVVQKFIEWVRPVLPTTAITTPVNTVIPTSKPDFGVTVTGVGVDAAAIRERVELQISTDSSFAGGLTTLLEAHNKEQYYTTTPAVKITSYTGANLSQNIPTYYARARVVDQFNVQGSWSATYQFTVSHTPSTINESPASDSILTENVAGTTFGWKFIDAFTGDVQTAFKLEIYNGATMIYDTGKLTSAAQSALIVVPTAGNLEVPLDWRVFVYDLDDKQSASKFQTNVFHTSPPGPIITFPATDGDVVNTGTPTISWDTVIVAPKIQMSWRLQIQRYSDKLLILDSGVVTDTAQTYVVPASKLRNNTGYMITLSVTDSVGLQTSVQRLINTSWTPPTVRPAPSVFTDRYNTDGYVSIEVGTAGADVDITTWQLYRRTLETSFEWTLVDTRATTDLFYTVRDYLCPAGVTVEYVVSQQADRFGDIVESPLSLTNRTQINLGNTQYWLIDVDEPTNSVLIPTVTSESYQQDIEETSYTVINRGRIVEVGEDSGVSGTLSCQIRNQERGWYNHENYNLLANANLHVDASAAITNWTTFDTGAQLGGIAFDETDESSGPGNRARRLYLTCSKATGSTNQLQCGVSQSRNASPYLRTTLGTKYFASAWVHIPTGAADCLINLDVQWRTGATVVGTESVAIPGDPASIIPVNYVETRVVGGDTWYRIGRVITSPSNAVDNVNFRVYVTTTSTTTPTMSFAIEGATLTVGSDPVQYFDGYTHGAAWLMQENIDPSYNPGFLSARSIRQQLEDAKKNNHTLYLRNPFGDYKKVHLSGLSISRVAGVGANEFVDVEIPYMEVAG